MSSGPRRFALPALALLLLAATWFFWPGKARDSSRSEDQRAAERSADRLEERKEARRQLDAMREPAALSGRVVDGVTGEPLPQAMVSMTMRNLRSSFGGMQDGMDDGGPLRVRTGTSGDFHFAPLAPGRYSVSAAYPGYLPKSVDRMALASGEDKEDLVIELVPGGYRLKGTVSDIGGGPVGDALIRAVGFSDFGVDTFFRAPFSTTTDMDGNYELTLPDGSFTVLAMHPDYRKETKQISMGGQDQLLDLTLTPGSIIEGVVLRRGDDTPVEGAQVTYNPMGTTGGFVVSGFPFNGNATTDAQGKFVLRGLGSGSFELRASSKNDSSREATIVDLGIADVATEVVVYVEQAYSISGFVLNRDDDESPQPDVMVGAYNFSPGAVFVAENPSAKDGYFEIHGVQPGNYTVGAAGEKRLPNFFGENVNVVDRDIEGLVVTLDAGLTLSGRVDPPIEAEIRLSIDMRDIGFSQMFQAAGAMLVHTTSDEEGNFTLEGVGRGDYQVVASASDGRSGKTEVSMSESQRDVVVTLEKRGSIRGVVKDDQGRPVPGVVVDTEPRGRNSFIRFGPNRGMKVVKTGPDGQFEAIGLEDGVYDLTVRDREQLAWADAKEDGEPNFEPVAVEIENARDERNLVLRVESRDNIITGTVRGPSGEALADAWVKAFYRRHGDTQTSGDEEDDESRNRRRRRRRWRFSAGPVLTDEDGRFRLEGLRKGNYDLEAEGARGSAKGAVELIPVGSNVVIDIDALGSLTGRVTKGGSPVDDYVIHLSGPARRRLHVARDDGRFRLGRLDTGIYEVEVTSTRGHARSTVEIESGKEAELALPLATFGSISGTLIDATKQEPVKGLAVMARVGEDGSKMAETAVALLTGGGPRSDKEGAFRIDKLGSGKGTLLVFDDDSTDVVTFQDFELAPGEDKDLGEIQVVLANRVPEEERGDFGFEVHAARYEDSQCFKAGKKRPELGDAEHLWVFEVKEGGAAERAGLAVCDRITHVNSVPADQVGSALVMRKMMQLRNSRIGTELSLGVEQESGPNTISVVAEKPAVE